MKHLYKIVILLLISGKTFSANIKIIQPYNVIYTSDTVWKYVATNMGHNATIVQDTMLDNTFFFSTTDVLITPVYDIIFNPVRINNIIAFMQTGKSVYLQSEYDLSFNGNQAYQSIVNSLGGSFSWIGTVAGVLAPMNVLGTLATTPITIPPLTYFWYGCNANVCNNFDSYLEYGGQYFGFTFCPPATGVGRLMTTSDQDWIIQLTSLDLMENMITLLLSPPGNCGFTSATINLGNDTTLCTGDHLLLGAGISATSYLWSNGATTGVILVDSSATYWLQITAAGCTAFDTIAVTFNPCSINASFQTADPSICPGTCTDFTNFSVNATSYQWFFPGANPSVSTDFNPSVICYNTPGSYDVTLIATDGTLIDTLLISNYITVYPFPAAQGISQSGDTLIAIQGANSYQWYHDGFLIPGATDYFYIAQASGNFNVVCTDPNGCEVEAVIFDVVASLTPVLSKGEGVTAFPNPVTDRLTIQNLNYVNGERTDISIYNVIGEKIFEANDYRQMIVHQGESVLWQIDCQFFQSGIYWIELTTNKKIFHTKFNKQ
ncbi:MAG: T9SS type A sorting domain-containing protein [Bacteroidota bacterium]